MKLEGIIQKDGKVLGDDNCVYFVLIRGTDKEGFREVLLDAKVTGGRGFFSHQLIKSYIGMRIEFACSIKPYVFNYIIINNKEVKK